MIGLIAGTLTTIAFLPQVVRSIRTRDTAAISIWMYILIVVGSALWLTYGLMLGEIPLILANGSVLVLSCVVLGLKVRHG